jgi:hypothetical protein
MKTDHDAIHAEEHGVRRSPRWPAVERAFLKAKPWCECCGRDKVLPRGVQVHHCFPFHFAILLGRPDLELDPRNLIGLCETEKGIILPCHHVLLGHLDLFKSYNAHVREDAAHRYHGWSAAQIKACPVWQAMVASRPKLWQDMTDEDKRAMRAAMDRLLPRSA